MPTSIDILRQKREAGYGTDGPARPDGAMDRAFTLTPEELQAIGQKEGPVSCQVSGTLTPDGKLTVESVTAPGGGGYDKQAPSPMMMPA